MSKTTAVFKNLLAVSLISASFAAVAAEPYFGGSFAMVDYSTEGSTDASLNVIYGRAGLNFNDNISSEVRLGFGVGDDTVTDFGREYTLELKNFLGAYLRGGIPVGETFYPYAIIGYTRGEVDYSYSFGGITGGDSETSSDLSYGVGADFSVTESIKINAEYMSYFDKDGAELSGFSIGVAKTF